MQDSENDPFSPTASGIPPGIRAVIRLTDEQLNLRHAATLAGRNQTEIRMSTNEIRELNDAELEVAAGELDCDAARIAASVWRSVSDVFFAIGDNGNGAYYNGRAEGVEAGACGSIRPDPRVSR